MKDHTKGLLITALGVLFIVPDSLFVRLIETDAITIAFWRNLVSGAVALAGLVALRGRSTIATIRGTSRYGVIYSVCVAATGILFVLAVSLTSVANVVFIIAAMPVFAALFSWIALKEPVTRRMILTMATVGMGLAVIAYGSGEHERASLEGDLVAIGVACLFAIAQPRRARVGPSRWFRPCLWPSWRRQPCSRHLRIPGAFRRHNGGWSLSMAGSWSYSACRCWPLAHATLRPRRLRCLSCWNPSWRRCSSGPCWANIRAGGRLPAARSSSVHCCSRTCG